MVEDARSARAFLKRVAAVAPLAVPLQAVAMTELPRARKGSREGIEPAQWQALLEPAVSGHDLGLLSEAGLPAVADPGAAVVEAAHAAGLTVVPLAGPSALVLALAASGLNGQSFAFVGYLPQEATERAKRMLELESIALRTGQTQLFIETPYRNEAVLQALLQHLQPSTRLSVSSGLTLPHAQTRSRLVKAWRQQADGPDNSTPAVFAIGR